MQMAGAGKVDEPPGKKRKLEDDDCENQGGFWDDDDDDLMLTQDQWQNLDNNVTQFLSQHPQNHNNNNVSGAPKVGNLGKSPRSLGRGMPKSHSAGNYGRTTPNSSFVKTPTGVAGSAGLPPSRTLQQNHGMSSSSRMLTPQAGSATVSPALPTQAKINMPDPTEKLRKEMDHYKQQIQSLKQSQYGKDGQITMLKKSLMEKDRLLGQLHQEKIQQIEAQTKEKSEREKSLEAELEKLSTQMQFKEHEITELQNSCKRLEAKASTSSSDGGGSPRKNGPVSPRRSPRMSSPRGTQGSPFPNRRTFMEEARSAERPITKRAKILFEDVPTTSKTSSSTKEIRENLLKLDISNNKGAITGGMLVSKLLSQPKVTDQNSCTGLVSLMASSPEVQKEASLSPVLPKRIVTGASPVEETSAKTSVKVKDALLISQGLNGLLLSDYDCSSAVLLLPAIEDQLATFIDCCNELMVDRNRLPVVTGSNCDDQKPAENELFTKYVEPVCKSLTLLLKIATWCGHCREALLNKNSAASSYSCSLIGVRGTPSNSQSNDYAESESTDLQIMPAQDSLSIQNVAKKNKILDQVIQLSRPHLPNGAPQKMQVLHLSLKILVQIALHISAESVDRFSKLFTDEILLHCLSPDVRENDEERVSLYVTVLDILCPLIKYSSVVDRMCAKSGDCLFNAIYTAAGHSLQVQSCSRTLMTQKIMQCINEILCHHENGNRIILERDCQCSHQVARCVVTILHAELVRYQRTGKQEQKVTLRQGISCLQTLSMVDRRGAVGGSDDAEIAQLVYSMERLMKDDKSVSELEIAALQDLWDFFDVEQDDQ